MIEDRASHCFGFVVPTYTGSGDDKEEVREHAGQSAVFEELQLKVERYDDSTFKYWCYDTPGLVNPNQVSTFKLDFCSD